MLKLPLFGVVCESQPTKVKVFEYLENNENVYLHKISRIQIHSELCKHQKFIENFILLSFLYRIALMLECQVTQKSSMS
jgi:hypothetical protein